MLDDPLTFTVPGHPQGKGRARAYRRGSFIGHYTPEKTRTYEGIVRTIAYQEMNGRPPFEGPVELWMMACFDVPSTWSKTKKALAISGALRPTKKPDLDNIQKAVTDALNAVVYKDDAQIVTTSCVKMYGPAAQIVVTVAPLATATASGLPGDASNTDGFRASTMTGR